MAAGALLLHLLFFIFALGPVTARPSAPSSRSPSQRRQNACAVTITEDEIRAGLREKAMDLGPGSFRITTNAASGKAFLDARRYTDACAVEVVFQPMESGATQGTGNDIRFALYLPNQGQWNRRFLTVGNGGYSGEINYNNMYVRVRHGFAVMSTNTGHEGDINRMQSLEVQKDWAYRAMKYSVPIAKAVVGKFYGEDAAWSYYAGCSTGGRQGLRQLEEDLDSFDGLLIGAPAWDTVGLQSWGAYIYQLNQAAPAPDRIEGQKVILINETVFKGCADMVDNTYPIIKTPEACRKRFQEDPILWNAGSETEMNLLNGLISNLMDPEDPSNVLYEGYDITAAPYFNIFIDRTSLLFAWTIHDGFSALLREGGLAWGDGLEYIQAARAWNERVGRSGATPARLAGYGGKILMYTGMIDSFVPGPHTFKYFDQASKVVDNIKYFEVPGMEHCTVRDPSLSPWFIGVDGIPGSGFRVTDNPIPTDRFNTTQRDALMALIDWTEGGTEVTTLEAVVFENNTWGTTYEEKGSMILTAKTARS
jgi:feruloyl esterase